MNIAADKDLVGGVVRTIFPQLRESEDERIRNEIIEFIRSQIEDGNSAGWDRWISYLEKQKDASKAIEAVDRIDKYIDEHVVNIHDMKDSDPDKMYYRGWDDALGKMAGILQDVYSNEKQKVNTEGDFGRGYDCGYQAGYSVAMNEMKPKVASATLDSEKQKEQKPAEWGEEDNIGWDEAFACVTKTERAAKDEEELQNAVTAEKWLKEIKFKYCVHPKPKQEWSEEDEEMLNSCISSIEESKENRYAYKETDGDTSYDHEIDWLKSLRPQPHWKPSEEQMWALDVALENFYNQNDRAALESLYNDLKKL